jgi:Domain of unknown function (DUF1906)
MKGFDTTDPIVGLCHSIVGLGMGFVIRYISPNTTSFPNKRLTEAEVTGAHSVGLKLGCVWETTGDLAAIGTGHGENDAAAAIAVMKELGAPEGAAVYFAVDFDATPGQIANTVLPYFSEIHSTFANSGYLVGVYGSGAVCNALKGAGVAHFTWLAQSRGWLGSSAFYDWDISQGSECQILGLDVDTDLLAPGATGGLW